LSIGEILRRVLAFFKALFLGERRIETRNESKAEPLTSDEISEHANVKAFLKAIRLGEGTTDPAGYYRIVGGQMFTDDSKHPGVKVWIPRYKVWSSAAGAYQIISPTWKGLVQQYGFTDFTPKSQDAAAVALIKGRGALNDVIAGRFTAAVRKCAAEWASLPGSTAGQRIESMEKVKQVYLDNGGTINE
jgi:muramidase (phage lysozyme)